MQSDKSRTLQYTLLWLLPAFMANLLLFLSWRTQITFPWDSLLRWRWDTELHSTYPLFSPQMSWIGPHSVQDRELWTRFPDPLPEIPWEPYFSNFGLSAKLIALIPTESNIVGPAIIYGLSLIFSGVLVYICIRGILLLGAPRLVPVMVVSALLSPWLLLDFTTVHWNPALRFAPLFFLPIAIYLYRTGGNRLSIFLLTSSGFVMAGNGFEFVPIVLVTIIFAVSLIETPACSIRFVCYVASGVVLSIVAWFFSIATYFGDLARAFEGVLFIGSKHSGLAAEAQPAGFVGPVQSASFTEFLDVFYRSTFFLSPVTMDSLGSYFPMAGTYISILGWANLALLAILIFIVFLTKGPSVSLHLLRRLAVFHILSLVAMLPIVNYVSSHPHIMGTSFSLFFMVNYAVMVLLSRPENSIGTTGMTR